MLEAERHKIMIGLLKDRPFASVRDLQEILDASPATIRRDIAKLHSSGAVRKVFGGIAAADVVSGIDRLAARPFTENQMLGVEAKTAIAQEAAKTAAGTISHAVDFDKGTLLIYVSAKELRKRPDAAVVRQNQVESLSRQERMSLFHSWFAKQHDAARIVSKLGVS